MTKRQRVKAAIEVALANSNERLLIDAFWRGMRVSEMRSFRSNSLGFLFGDGDLDETPSPTPRSTQRAHRKSAAEKS